MKRWIVCVLAAAFGAVIVVIRRSNSNYQNSRELPPYLTHDVQVSKPSGRSYNLKYHTCKEVLFQKRLPDALLIGERRSGTGTLGKFLRTLNPHIKVPFEESHFFDTDAYRNRGFKSYINMMPRSCPGDITLDNTPSYFRTVTALERIYKWNIHVRLLLSLRDPIERAVSDFYFDQRNGKGKGKGRYKRTFEDMAIDNETKRINADLESISRSLYDVNLRRWLRSYPLEQIHIVDADNFAIDPVSELRKVEIFLGIQPMIENGMVYFNQSSGYYYLPEEPYQDKSMHSFPQLDEDLYNKLVDFYAPHVQDLYTMIGDKLSWMDKYIERMVVG